MVESEKLASTWNQALVSMWTTNVSLKIISSRVLRYVVSSSLQPWQCRFRALWEHHGLSLGEDGHRMAVLCNLLLDPARSPHSWQLPGLWIRLWLKGEKQKNNFYIIWMHFSPMQPWSMLRVCYIICCRVVHSYIPVYSTTWCVSPKYCSAAHSIKT